jgi:hypothetical protein
MVRTMIRIWLASPSYDLDGHAADALGERGETAPTGDVARLSWRISHRSATRRARSPKTGAPDRGRNRQTVIGGARIDGLEDL